MKLAKIKQIIYISSFAICGIALSIVGYQHLKPTENFTQSYSMTDAEKGNSYDFAKKLAMDENEFMQILSDEQDNKKYALIPANKDNKNVNYWVKLTTTEQDYVQTFFLNRTPYTVQKAKENFETIMHNMWEQPKPSYIFFVATLDKNYAGIIYCNGLLSSEITIGYITEKAYSGQKVSTNSLKFFVNLIKKLNSDNFYNIKTAALWIFDDNIASINVAQNNNFKESEMDIKNKRKKYTLKL